MKTKLKLIAVFILITAILPLAVLAGEEKISVAVTESFMPAFKEIAADFEDRTGVKVVAVYAPARNLYRQIKKGVLYDAFLAEDEVFPTRLQNDKWTQGTFIYARNKNLTHHGCIAKKAKNQLGAEMFMMYMLCEHAVKIRNKHGYQ